MARYARLEAPGAVHHLVSRFVNEEFRMCGDFERSNYLARVPSALCRTDWSALSYGLMSNHTHWGFLGGAAPSASFVKPLHSGYAGWLNKYQHRLGPVFADRHRSIICDEQHAALLVAYIHNNPVRAGVVKDPADSPWTSHRAYVGLAPAPPWLNVERGLSECGFDSSPRGRLAFHDFVLSRSADPRSDELSGAGLARQRAAIRSLIGSSVECSWPRLLPPPATSAMALVAPAGQCVRPFWGGDADLALRTVAEQLDLTLEELCSRVRTRRLTAARRTALHLWTYHFGRRQSEIRAALQLSSGGASRLLRASRADWRAIDRVAALLAARLRSEK
jgi:hypothetical protein